MKTLAAIIILFSSLACYSQITTSYDGKKVYVYRVFKGRDVYARKSGENWVKVTSRGLPGRKIDAIAAAFTPSENTTFVYALSGNNVYGRRSGENWNKITNQGLPKSYNIKFISARYSSEEKKVFLYAELADGKMYARRSGEGWNKIQDIGSSSSF